MLQTSAKVNRESYMVTEKGQLYQSLDQCVKNKKQQQQFLKTWLKYLATIQPEHMLKLVSLKLMELQSA